MTMPAPMTTRSRIWRFSRRLVVATTMTAIAAAAAVYFALPVIARQPCMRYKAERALTRWTGAPVQINDMAWSWRGGLTLQGLSVAAGEARSLTVEKVQLKPHYGKLVRGKLRLKAALESPEIVMAETAAETAAITLPRFSKRGFRLDAVEIRNGAYVLRSPGSARTVRVENLSARGTGGLDKRTFRLELASLTATLDQTPVSGKGVVRMDGAGLSGEVDLNEAAARESSALRDALRASRVTIRKAPALSEPF